MKAVILTHPCEAKDINISETAVPELKPGWLLIRVKSFGLNHSEVLLRKFEIENSYINKPIIPGIECVGEVVDANDTRFHNGEKVMALMGGMGRSFNGSYAEYVLMPEKQVFRFKSNLEWAEMGAIPETFYTAYGSLFQSLQLKKDDILLIRGGTSTVGLAALQMAKAIGATVISTTRHEENFEMLQKIGADGVMLEGDDFIHRFLEHYPSGVSKVLELIGASTLRESLKLTSLHGIVCHTGLLGGVYGLKNFDPIKGIPSGVYLTGFYSNNPNQHQIDGMMKIIEKGDIHPIIARRFSFEEIAEAHELAEKRGVTGKIVVEM